MSAGDDQRPAAALADAAGRDLEVVLPPGVDRHVAPRVSKAQAIARPMPWPDPVTTATRPSRRS